VHVVTNRTAILRARASPPRARPALADAVRPGAEMRRAERGRSGIVESAAISAAHASTLATRAALAAKAPVVALIAAITLRRHAL